MARDDPIAAQQVALTQLVQHAEYLGLLNQIRLEQPAFRAVASWHGVAALLRDVGAGAPQHDAFLRALLAVVGPTPDEVGTNVFLFLFFPALLAVFHRKRQRMWDQDHDLLWSNVQWTFLQSLHHLCQSSRRDRIWAYLRNQVIHRLSEMYRRRWRREGTERSCDSIDFWQLAAMPSAYEGTRRRLRIARLEALLARGELARVEFELIVATRELGMTVAEYAAASQKSFEALRKRRQRCEARIGWPWDV